MKTLFKILIGYFLFLILSYFLGGCASIEKAKQQHQEKKANEFFNAHPDKDAQRCADHFPGKDSAGPLRLDSVKNANNIDYTAALDSLHKLADSLLQDSINRYWIMVLDSSNEMAVAFRKMLLKQQQDNALLKNALADFQKKYKPCEPEKEYYTADHFTIDGATAAAYAAEKKLNDQLQQKINAATATSKTRTWMLIAAGSIILLLLIILIAGAINRIKNKLTIPHL